MSGCSDNLEFVAMLIAAVSPIIDNPPLPTSLRRTVVQPFVTPHEVGKEGADSAELRWKEWHIPILFSAAKNSIIIV